MSQTGLAADQFARLHTFYRDHLLCDILPFWENRTQDSECGGYLTCFDQYGNQTDTTKYIWFQGRQLWMFSALCNHIQPRDSWRRLALCGRDFIVSHAYIGDGRWHYQLDRQGNPQRGSISIFTDLFVLQGLCEYAQACDSDQDLALIRQTYDTAEENIYNPDFKDIFHATWSPRFKRHGIYMIALNAAQLAEPVLGPEHTRPLIDHCLDQILNVFAKDEHEALFESVGHDGSFVDCDEGRVLNPGHALESMWFCIEEGRRRQDRSVIERAVRIAQWMYDRGHDREHGGMVSFLDASGQLPRQMDWHKETGMSWHDKSWWVHSESLYALALCAVETRRMDLWEAFIHLHQWCKQQFHDAEYGEWYAELYRDGRPKVTDKGTVWKAAFHLPRALMKLMQLFKTSSAV